MDYDQFIKEIKDSLDFTHGIISPSTYSSSRRQLALIYFKKGEEIEGIYNLTESHGIGLRQISLTQSARSSDALCYSDYLSFEEGYAKDQVGGMLERLKEMPSEWTLVQLTREFDKLESYKMRAAETTPVLKGFHLTRLPCGNELQIGCPVTVDREWPRSSQQDLIADFWKIKKQLSTKAGSCKVMRKLRKEAAMDVEKYCREIGQVCLKEWLVLFLGTLYDPNLSSWIRGSVNMVLNSRKGISKRQKYLTYLLAEGSAHISDEDLDCALEQLYPENISLQEEIVQVIVNIKKEKSNLPIARRHPVLLIVDEHLDLVPWESLLLLRRHPISRVPSIHFAHALFKIHREYIKNGLRELNSNGICYYILNPSGDLQGVEQRLCRFIQKRFPSWIGIVGQKPTEEQLVEALTKGNAFIYCGHGNGCQFLSGDSIQRLQVKPVQLLFGCSSVALKDHGGPVEMTGDFLQFAIAGSGCTLGMLWPVTSYDTDKMTIVLANMWLPGDPIDTKTLEKTELIKKEPELLRALVEVRKCAELFTNGAGFVARGIPIKLI